MKLSVGGGGGVHKGPFGYDRRDQKIVGYADIVSIFITPPAVGEAEF